MYDIHQGELRIWTCECADPCFFNVFLQALSMLHCIEYAVMKTEILLYAVWGKFSISLT